mmetsp:Transcript_6485/g.8644  ORF Transcript_6485/g.8644 Transcript_6485/m.8644 type:complete len:84 (+) Transcript_6485:448-699(+)
MGTWIPMFFTRFIQLEQSALHVGRVRMYTTRIAIQMDGMKRDESVPQCQTTGQSMTQAHFRGIEFHQEQRSGVMDYFEKEKTK